MHWITWSRGLRDLVGLTAEKSDEEVAAQDHDVEGDQVAVAEWEHVAPVIDDLRECINRRSAREKPEVKFRALCEFLDAAEVPWRLSTQTAFSAELRDSRERAVEEKRIESGDIPAEQIEIQFEESPAVEVALPWMSQVMDLGVPNPVGTEVRHISGARFSDLTDELLDLLDA